MTNDYIKFQKQHGLKMEPKVDKFNPVNPLKEKTKGERNQLLRSKWQAVYKKKKRNKKVAKLVEGTLIFDQTVIPKDSADFWRGSQRQKI